MSPTITLASLRLPPDGPLAREMPLPPEARSEKYVQRFDALTLVYDSFYDPASRELVLICPRLLNLWPALKEGLYLDGQPIGRRLRRKKLLRIEILRLRIYHAPTLLEFRTPAITLSTPIASTGNDPFAGKNCLVTLSKDNPIEWIEDWVRYHVAAHSANAVLLFDNGSQSYSSAEVQHRLEAVPGIDVARVISADFPYGEAGGGRRYVPAMFLQTGLLNIAQQRFLADARAVLSIDIDEMVWSVEGDTIFDAAVRSRLGQVTFHGHAVYPAEQGRPRPQSDHSLIAANDHAGNPKWCVRPQSPAGRHSWAVHRPGGVLYPFTISRRIWGFWHCYACSTGWKVDRTRTSRKLAPCPRLVSDIAAFLPGRSQK